MFSELISICDVAGLSTTDLSLFLSALYLTAIRTLVRVACRVRGVLRFRQLLPPVVGGAWDGIWVWEYVWDL